MPPRGLTEPWVEVSEGRAAAAAAAGDDGIWVAAAAVRPDHRRFALIDGKPIVRPNCGGEERAEIFKDFIPQTEQL